MDVIRILVMGRVGVKRLAGLGGCAAHLAFPSRPVTATEGKEFSCRAEVSTFFLMPSPKIFILLELRRADRGVGLQNLES
jgi:hypothetical protein